MSNGSFVTNLIKGRITETIFHQMFQEATTFTIIPLGYENIIPELAQYQHKVKNPTTLNNLRNVPDFLLISKDKDEVHLVEVKYRKSFTGEQITKEADEINQKWDNVYLFVATNDTFYFDKCANIVKKSGRINTLDSLIIQEGIQKKYLSCLNEFLR